MSPSYYHNLHAKCDFKENRNKFWRSNHGRDSHERIYETKNNKLVSKVQNLISSPIKVKKLALTMSGVTAMNKYHTLN